MKRSLFFSTAILFTLIPYLVSAQDANLTIYCGALPGCNQLWGQYIGSVLVFLLSYLPVYVYLVGVIFIMIGGAYMILSAGNTERVEKGKKTVLWAVIGIFIMTTSERLVSFVFLETTGRIGNDDVIISVGNTLITTIFDLLFVALLGVAIFCGMWMVLARGKEEDFKKAQTGLVWAAVGAIVINLAAALANAIAFPIS